MSAQTSNRDLYTLVTIPEAARLYYRGQSTIRYHIDRGNLSWRKTEGDRGIYLISLQSLIALWGNPPGKIVAS